MKVLPLPAAFACLPFACWAQHDHESHDIEEIIVSGSQNKTRAETALPVEVLTGESLRKQAAATIGESLKNQAGVHSSSFGPGVGQPVIRGLSGNRVKVLQNSVGTLDVSGASQDHASAVEALVAERVEIVRGPATLLYGSGAIGGIVNVVDNRVPDEAMTGVNGAMEVRTETANDAKIVVSKLDGGTGNFAWHFDGLYRDTNNVEVPEFAIDEAALEALEGDHEEGAEEEHEEPENTRGFIANSNTEAKNATVGGSWVGDNGYFGISVSRLENEYGLPPGAHGAGHHEEEGAAEEEEEHGEEFVRLEMEQTRTEIKGERQLSGWFNRVRGQVTINNYEHAEMEGAEVGTIFDNEGVEGRFTANHAGDDVLSGVVGLQISTRDFSAIGDEAFIPPADIESTGLFVIETVDLDNMSLEFGLRGDRDSIDTRGGCDTSDSSWSASAATIWPVRSDTNMTVGLSRSERAPTVEERYSNVDTTTCAVQADPEAWVVHAATARLELGNPDLNTEVSNNLELGVQKFAGAVELEANIFYNRFDDFIYLADTGEFEETIVSTHLQEDATFRGLEAKLLFPVSLGSDDHHLDVSLFGDYVEAELDRSINGNDNVPRIPPHRVGIELGYNREHTSFTLRTTKVAEQDDTALNELASDGYTRVDAYMDYHLLQQNRELVVFLKGSNLTDREIRDHTSLLKHFAPAPGRSFELGVRVSF